MGSWNIGAFIYTTNSFAIVGEGFRPQTLSIIENVLNVPVIVQKIYDEDLVGCLIAATSNGIVVPYETHDEEIARLKKQLDTNIEKIHLEGTYSNALGNLILANEKKAIIKDKIYNMNRETMKKIEDVLGVEVIPYNINLTDAIASYILANSRGIVFSPLFTSEDVDNIREILGYPRTRTIISTVNTGLPIIRSGAVANDNGLLVGNKATGVELARIFNTLIKE